MKKVLLFLVIFLTSISVKAQTYYSDYSNWSEYGIDNISNTELKNVEVERRYRWYKNKEEGEYLLYNDGINNYDFVNLSNYIETEYSNWNIDRPKEENGRIIENYKKYAVKKVKPIKKIYILNGTFKGEEVNLNQIKIYNKDKLVHFTYICGGCSGGYILNNINGILMIELDNYYYFDDLTIVINPINKSDIYSLKFLILSPVEGTDKNKNYYEYVYESNSDINISLNVKKFNILSPEYEEEKIYQELPPLSYSDEVREINYYRYKDRLYYFYNNNKEYVEGYFKDYTNYIKDETEYVDYFRYRIRDKLEIDEYIEINNKQTRIENYINSTVEYQISGNVDYNKNAIYIINVKTYFISKNIPVFVNIKENEKNNVIIVEKENKDLIEHYNKLTDEKKLLYNDYQNLKNEKNNLFLNYQNLTNKYNKLFKEKNMISLEINSCQEELEKFILKNDDNEKKLKLSNQAYDYLSTSLLKINNTSFQLGFEWYLWLLFLIILLIIFLIIIFNKRKNKNKF